MTGPRPVKVLYFVGSGRSGTTLINGILGGMPGVLAGGELRYVWQRGVAQNHVCSCGKPFDECVLWTRIMERVLTMRGAGPEDPGRIGPRLLQRLQLRRVPAMLLRWRFGGKAVPPHPDDASIEALYRAASDVSGARVVVDSSKLPPYGMLLAQIPGIDLRVLHVVRDPRATAYSWLREKKALDHGDDGALMPRQPVTKSSLLWLVWNTVSVLRWGGQRESYLRLRYEDFVAEPEASMRRVCELVGLDPADLPFTSAAQVDIRPGHVVAGNPNRHQRGEVAIRPDDQWRGGLSVKDKLAVTTLTAPGLIGFAYPLSPHAPGHAPRITGRTSLQ